MSTDPAAAAAGEDVEIRLVDYLLLDIGPSEPPHRQVIGVAPLAGDWAVRAEHPEPDGGGVPSWHVCGYADPGPRDAEVGPDVHLRVEHCVDLHGRDISEQFARVLAAIAAHLQLGDTGRIYVPGWLADPDTTDDGAAVQKGQNP